MDNISKIDLVIVGGGSAGLAAAISAKENGIDNILILEKEKCLGGILQQCIHNGFGLHTFKEQLSGPEYAERFIVKAKQLNIEYKLNTYVISISKDKDIIYSNAVDGFVHIKASAIIMATGCTERTPGAIMLEGDRGSGIMTAGQAQRFLNIEGYMVGKKIFILGSGDIGLIMARRLTLEGAKVLGVAEIMPYSNGLNRNIAQCLNDFDIPLYLSHTIKCVEGLDRVNKVTIVKVDDKMNQIDGSEISFDVDTLILSVGLVPYNVLIDHIGTRMSSTKGAMVDENYQTSIPGIFACGNALHVHDLVDYVTDEAYLAGIGAARFIKGQIDNSGELTFTVAKHMISYVVPQMYRYDNIEKEILFKYRVRKPIKNASVVVKLDNVVIKTIKKAVLLPSEMELLKINKSLLAKGKELSFEIVKEDN